MRSSFNNWLDNSGILNSAIIRLKSPVFAVVFIVVVFVVESTVEDDLPIVVVSSIRCVVLEVVCSFARSVVAFSCGSGSGDAVVLVTLGSSESPENPVVELKVVDEVPVDLVLVVGIFVAGLLIEVPDVVF